MYCRFTAGLGRETTAKFGDDSTLLANGKHVDTVAEVSKVSIHLPGLPTEAQLRRAVREWFEFSGRVTSSDRAYVAGGEYSDAFCRTVLSDWVLTGGINGQGAEASRVGPWVKPQFLSWMKTPDRSASSRSPLATAVLYTAHGRAFFKTEQGYIGVGPSHMKRGDEVFVVFGSPTPFVFRRQPSPGDGTHEESETEEDDTHEESKTTTDTSPELSIDPMRYELIGYCYLHGVMDGEFVANENIKETTIRIC